VRLDHLLSKESTVLVGLTGLVVLGLVLLSSKSRACVLGAALGGTQFCWFVDVGTLLGPEGTPVGVSSGP
jgi:hypothetical protein